MMIAGQIDRERWEEPRYTIGAHTRSGPQQWTECEYVAIHYTAAETTPAKFDAVRLKLQASQRDYVLNRGYSLGYNWAVDRLGTIWEIRGADYQCAANGNTDTNKRGPAVLCLVNAGAPANDRMIEAVRLVIGTVSTAAGRIVPAVPHSALRPTQCPGAGLSAQIAAGVFEIGQPPMNQYLATPPPKYRTPHRGSFIVAGAAVRYATTTDAEWCAANGVPKVELNDEQYENLYRNVFGALPA